MRVLYKVLYQCCSVLLYLGILVSTSVLVWLVRLPKCSTQAARVVIFFPISSSTKAYLSRHARLRVTDEGKLVFSDGDVA
jgi:hypothetical protein